MTRVRKVLLAVGFCLASSVAVGPALAVCDPLPGDVSFLRLAKTNGDTDLLFTWDNTTDADDYVLFEDPIFHGSFDTITGTAPDGTTGLTLALPSASGFYLVAGRNAVCGLGRRGTAAGDFIPPAVAITDPENLSLLNTPTIAVSGTVEDEDVPFEVFVNGVPATVNGDAFEATDVPVREGVNPVTATAIDRLHNVGTATVSVTLDTTPPIAAIDSHQDGAIVNQATIDVTGVVNDITTGQVNGDDVTVAVETGGHSIPATVSNGSFLASGLPLLPRPQTITTTATDQAGNSSVSMITVTRQEFVGAKISLVSGNHQSALIGMPLAEPLVVELTDPKGAAMANRPVIFSATRSDGFLSSPDALPTSGRVLRVISDSSGQASVNLTLGDRNGVGNNRVQATASGFAGEVVFYASAVAGSATGLKVILGENQTGVAGQELPEPLVTLVHDEHGNPIEGVPVTFEVLEGDGSFAGESSLSVLSNSDGRGAAVLTLGPQAGTNSNLTKVTFAGMIEQPAIFVASAVVSGPLEQTRVSGVVLDNTNNPVPGVTTRVSGTLLEAVTDAGGQFSMLGAPVGHVDLEVDGTTTMREGTWPVLHFEMVTISGHDNTLGMPIYILPLDTNGARTVGGDREAVLQMADVEGLRLTIAPNSVTCPDGSDECLAMITQVHRDKVPMPPPGGAAPRLVWTIQPPGIQFDPPARISYPNVDGLSPGQIVDIFSFDHDLFRFVSIGFGSVSEDGSLITSDPGVGIRKGGWGFPAAPPPPTTCPNGCGACLTCDDGRCVGDPAQAGAPCELSPPDQCWTGSGSCSVGGNAFCLGNLTPVDCDDGDACNGEETCDPATGCLAGTPLDCDDDDQCTGDSCDSATGCANTEIPDCGCKGVTCPPSGDACNDNLCNPRTGNCELMPKEGSCDDGDACTTGDHCSGGSCVAGEQLVCDDGDACNGKETCDSATGCVAGEPLECPVCQKCESAVGCVTDDMDSRIAKHQQPGQCIVCRGGAPVSTAEHAEASCDQATKEAIALCSNLTNWAVNVDLDESQFIFCEFGTDLFCVGTGGCQRVFETQVTTDSFASEECGNIEGVEVQSVCRVLCNGCAAPSSGEKEASRLTTTE